MTAVLSFCNCDPFNQEDYDCPDARFSLDVRLLPHSPQHLKVVLKLPLHPPLAFGCVLEQEYDVPYGHVISKMVVRVYS